MPSGLTLWQQRLHAVGLDAPGNALQRVSVRGGEADHPVESTHSHRVAQLVCMKNMTRTKRQHSEGLFRASCRSLKKRARPAAKGNARCEASGTKIALCKVRCHRLMNVPCAH